MSSAQTSLSPAYVPTDKAAPGKALRRFSWAVLTYNVLVILWGAVVRATSSGAGCGDHWPLCNGVVVQSHPRLATMIELAHRMSSGLTVPLVLLLLVWTWRASVRGHLARVFAILATVLTLNEGLLGALLVLLRLTADNRSPARAVYLSLHLVNTLLLLGALALTSHFLSRGDGFRRKDCAFTQLPLTLTGLSAILLVGATGTLAALSDTLFPATSLAAAFTQDFSRSGGWLLRVRVVHPVAALAAAVFIAWLLVRAYARPQERSLASWVGVLLALQFGLGLLDVALLAPVWLQIVHLLGADVLWITLTILAARMSVRRSNQRYEVGLAEIQPPVSRGSLIP